MTDETDGPEDPPRNVEEFPDTPAERERLRNSMRGRPAADPRPVPEVGAHEIAIARAFLDHHGADWRFDHSRGQWMQWAGARWRTDRKQAAHNVMHEFCRRLALNVPAQARSLLQRKTAANALGVACSDPRAATLALEYDADPWLLGTPDGPVDLRTGLMLPPEPGQMISRITSVAPDFEMETPIWDAFLAEATGGSQELADWLQRFFGYCATGDMREEVVGFLHGPGGNGKGVMVGAISRALGEYAISTPSSTFMDSGAREHPTEIARMQGARLVTASETKQGQQWNLGRIKELSGNEGDISARFMRQDYFEFKPTAKLLLVSNDKPAIDNVDAAITRRMRMVEFANRPEKADTTLKERLAVETPGILAWVVRGAQRWIIEGLEPPKAVLDATRGYLAAEDAPARVIDEYLEFTAQGMLVKSDVKRLVMCWRSRDAVSTKRSDTQIAASIVERIERRDGVSKGRHNKLGFTLRGVRVTEQGWSELMEHERALRFARAASAELGIHSEMLRRGADESREAWAERAGIPLAEVPEDDPRIEVRGEGR